MQHLSPKKRKNDFKIKRYVRISLTGEKGSNMLKVVVFDSGYGGELFADYLGEELPVIEIIRVIDWRNADKILENPHSARKVAESSLRPFINKVDLIIFANFLLTATSLKYFKRKYKSQKFIGINLEEPSTFIKHDVLILTTKAMTKTINHYNFIVHLKRKVKVIPLDSWPQKIDDGELTPPEIKEAIAHRLIKESNFLPKEIILGCTHFYDIKSELNDAFGYNIKIYDGFSKTAQNAFKALKIRGGNFKRK